MRAPKTHLPLFGLRKNVVTTNELVFRVLTTQHPLSVAKIRTSLQQVYGQKLSYQAVRKSVLALQTIGVLQHTNGGYQISVGWLLKVRGLIDTTLERCRGKQPLAYDESAEYQSFSASTLYEADTFWGDLLLELCRSLEAKQRKAVVSINHYPWWLPINLGRESTLFQELSDRDFQTTFLFTKSGVGFVQAKNFYRAFGISTALCKGTKLNDSIYYNIVGDKILEVRLPEALTGLLHSAFSSPSSHAAMEKVAKLVKRRFDIRITIQQSAPLAQALLEAVTR